MTLDSLTMVLLYVVMAIFLRMRFRNATTSVLLFVISFVAVVTLVREYRREITNACDNARLLIPMLRDLVS